MSVVCLLAACGGKSGDVRLVRVAAFEVTPHYDPAVLLTSPPGDATRVFAVQKRGRIRIIENGRLLPRPFLDLSRSVSDDALHGLLSMAFAPDYAHTGLFYVYFTDPKGNVRVAELHRSPSDPDLALPASRREVLRVAEPHPNTEDVGGHIAFGPDGLLYISIGDGQQGYPPHLEGDGDALRLSTLRGKLLRIDPRQDGSRPYRVPPDNPFVHRRGARPEIYAYGLRNPWRFSFDGGSLWIADVGQDHWEEVDHVSLARAAGANFGWPAYEATHRFDRRFSANHVTMPVFEYPHVHVRKGCGGSIIGGFVVRDKSLPHLVGRYLYGDYCRPGLRSFAPSSPRTTDRVVTAAEGFSNIVSFGEDAAGRLYASQGVVYRLAAP